MSHNHTVSQWLITTVPNVNKLKFLRLHHEIHLLNLAFTRFMNQGPCNRVKIRE